MMTVRPRVIIAHTSIRRCIHLATLALAARLTWQHWIWRRGFSKCLFCSLRMLLLFAVSSQYCSDLVGLLLKKNV